MAQLQAASVSEGTNYPAFCQQAAMDDEIFAHFKRHPSYQGILEHVGYGLGYQYLKCVLKNDPKSVSLFALFRENDSLGDPITYEYGYFGRFSPTTLRYMKVASDLKRLFGDLSQMDIVEIGGGYGGQCKILADFTSFKSYTLIDLPEAIALTRKYLALLGVKNVHFITNANLSQVQSYDLVISNYAFSEIDRFEQQGYLDRVIQLTPNGYMTMNFISHGISIEDLVQMLRLSHREEKIEEERPVSDPKNLIVSWKPAA